LPQKIHLWVPNIFQFKGGIQVYSAFLLEALQALCPASEIGLFLKHDTHATPDISLGTNTRPHFAGWSPGRSRTTIFASQLLGYGLVQRPDLVICTHLHFTQAAYWLKRWAGIPYWTVAHGFEAWDIQRPSLRHALRHADRILSVSHYTRDRLLWEQDLSPAQVGLLPNTFHQERFHIAPKPEHLLQRYGLRSDQPVILTVSRLDPDPPYKGYDPVLRALPQIRAQVPNVHYLLVGTGSDRPRIEQFIHANGLESHVTLAGFVPDPELPDYYNLCDVFAMVSRTEGFGIVYAEAMASGKPAVGSNRDGAVDALAQGELGALVDPDDTHAIGHTLIQILQRTYPYPLLYQPDALRKEAIARFGRDRFRANVADLLNRWSLPSCSKLKTDPPFAPPRRGTQLNP
jgi:glycosyltransferase involved in cell wall biosynthesis